jgi:hypothetical protein
MIMMSDAASYYLKLYAPDIVVVEISVFLDMLGQIFPGGLYIISVLSDMCLELVNYSIS